MTILRSLPSAGPAAAVLGLTGVLALPPAGSAAPVVPPAPWVIDDRGPQGTLIAGFRVTPLNPAVQGPRVRAVIRRWGPPASARPFGAGEACTLVWLRPRVAVVAANFGLRPAGTTACSPGVGFVQRFQTLGSSWRTKEGLGIGASRARLRAIYPGAEAAVEGDPGILLLEPALHPCAPCTSPAELAASQRGAAIAFLTRGRVTRFVVQVGAAGD
jgi:hypothetical protein